MIRSSLIQHRELSDMEMFSVTQFFDNGTYETVRGHVSAEEAVAAFQHYTTCVAARLGMTRRVIITDGGDCVNYEWQFGKGITYPMQPVCAAPPTVSVAPVPSDVLDDSFIDGLRHVFGADNVRVINFADEVPSAEDDDTPPEAA